MATSLTGSAFADTNVVNGQTCFYTVTAINPALGGESPPSVEASAKPVYVTTSTAYQSAMLAAAPAVWWRLNETNGALLYDAIGSRNGTNAGSVALGAAGPRSPDFLGCEMKTMSHLNEQEMDLFYEAAMLADPAKLSEFLDQACAGNSNLRTRVEEFLVIHAEAEKFFTSAELATHLKKGDI